jgi:hypothetical protein
LQITNGNYHGDSNASLDNITDPIAPSTDTGSSCGSAASGFGVASHSGGIADGVPFWATQMHVWSYMIIQIFSERVFLKSISTFFSR